MKFNDLTGDCTDFVTQTDTFHIIPHVVNTCGVMGSGVALAIKNKFPIACDKYEYWYEYEEIMYNREHEKEPDCFPNILDDTNKFWQLGNIQVILVERQIFVCNMLAQKGFGAYGLPPGRMQSLEECLHKLASCCQAIVRSNKKVQIEAPKFGSCRSGLDWTKIFEMVQRIFKDIEGVWNTYSYEGPTK